MDFSSNPTIPALKSGDVITVKADGYTDLTFKLVIDNDGKATLVEDDGKGDPYELHVKIDGSFEAAVVGQKDYDGGFECQCWRILFKQEQCSKSIWSTCGKRYRAC